MKLVGGTTVKVLQKNDHGWWYGVRSEGPDGTPVFGYFPMNYVKEKPKTAGKTGPSRALPTPNASKTKSSGASTFQAAVKESASTPADEELTKELTKNRIASLPKSHIESLKKNGHRAFALQSLTAFDDLMGRGFAVETVAVANNNLREAESPVKLQPGMSVDIDCCAMSWDGADTLTEEFFRGTLSFVVGEIQQNQAPVGMNRGGPPNSNVVTIGLDLAMLLLHVGEAATVTCLPSLGYGPRGNAQLGIFPNKIIVYNLKVNSAKNSDGGVPTPPSISLATPNSASQNSTPHSGDGSTPTQRSSGGSYQNFPAQVQKTHSTSGASRS